MCGGITVYATGWSAASAPHTPTKPIASQTASSATFGIHRPMIDTPKPTKNVAASATTVPGARAEPAAGQGTDQRCAQHAGNRDRGQQQRVFRGGHVEVLGEEEAE